MNNMQIKFTEYRNFSELLNITFTFIRLELKPLLKTMLLLALPILILLGIILGIFHAENMTYVSETQVDFVNSLEIEHIQNLIIQYGLIILIYFISLSVISAIILGYIVEYIHNGAGVPFENVLAQVKIFLPRLLIVNLFYYFLVAIASLFLLIPGIYLAIALSLCPIVLVLEDLSIWESLKRSMFVVRSSWWRTFGYLIVISIIYSLISLIFSLPAGILSGLQTFGLISAPPDSPMMLIITIITNIISTISYLFMAIIIVFLSFFFYSQLVLKDSGNLLMMKEHSN